MPSTKKIEIICSFCGKTSMKMEKDYKYRTTTNPTNTFCNSTCFGRHFSESHGGPLNAKKDLSGKNNPNYKDGATLKTTCDCGLEKDYRAKKCAKCSKVSWGVGKKYDYEKRDDIDILIQYISTSKHLVEASARSGVSRSTLAKIIKKYNVDISHMIPAKGRLRPFEEVFCYKLRRDPTTRKYFRTLYPNEYFCLECNVNDVWNNKSLVLQMDHIDGDPLNDVLSNLRWLCPNCHSQTDTYTGKNSTLVKKRKEFKI